MLSLLMVWAWEGSVTTITTTVGSNIMEVLGIMVASIIMEAEDLDTVDTITADKNL